MPRPLRYALPPILAPLLLLGCSNPIANLSKGKVEVAEKTREQRIAAAPLDYLLEVQKKAATLNEYRVLFMRQERRGLFNALSEAEKVDVAFRAKPFSVKFVWRGDTSEFTEAAYVEGRENGKMIAFRRKSEIGFPRGIERHNPSAAVTFGRSRYSITDFGVKAMIDRTITRIEEGKKFGATVIRYVGPETLEGVACRHFELNFPRGDQYAAKKQDLFVDIDADVPIGSQLWLPNGSLDSMYLYLERKAPESPLPDALFAVSDAETD